ncbi:hypothetical protein PCE1_001133 [Barthelona sp. PCE]
MVGGYSSSDVDQVAVDLAVERINLKVNTMVPLQLKAVEGFQTQVVAGRNMSFTLVLEINGAEERHACVVFRDLQGNYEFDENAHSKL